jgi:hypothetical protein
MDFSLPEEYGAWSIGPIANEMARNSIAESLGLPRSF